MELQWIVRDGKDVLQKRSKKVEYCSGSPCGSVFINYGEWEDVPYVMEISSEIMNSFDVKKMKSEREKVCDEILDFLRGRVIERDQAHYFIADLLSKIREIRNRK